MKILLESGNIFVMENYLEKLNAEQYAAATCVEGAVLVLAGAGSGKTRVLTSRIAYILDHDLCHPSQILAITFTNKAANEMKERVAAMIGDEANSMWISTIHSMCLRILRANIGRLNGFDKNFIVYSEVDRDRVIKRIINELHLEGEQIFKNAKYHISYAKNSDISPNRYVVEGSGSDVKLYAKIYSIYDDRLKSSNAMDFDDLLLKTYHLLEDDADVREYYANKFRYIHIDEFQDTNFIQYNIAKLLSSVHGNIFVVGDDDQSIYSWRGAEIKNILGFDRDFKDTKVFKLQQNYRSSKKILELANTIIKNNSLRNKKTLWTENPDGVKIEYFCGAEEINEADYVAKQIRALVDRGHKFSDFAVLMRVNALSRSFEQQLKRQGITYKVFGGFKFFERKEIKDLAAYLRLVVNPLDDDALLRIINTPRRGIGDKTIEELIRYSQERNISLFDSLVENDYLNLSAGAKYKLENFRKLICQISLLSIDMPIDQLVEQIVEITNFNGQFERNSEEDESRKMNINEFISSVKDFCKLNKEATINDYLSSVSLYSDIDEADSSDYVSVATIHAVKGLEFKTVFIVGLDETIFPISRAVGEKEEMEEERRLMYVAITRAQQRLYLTRANSRFIYGQRQLTARSRFLSELAVPLNLGPSAEQRARDRSGEDDYSYSTYGNGTYVERRAQSRDYDNLNYGYSSDVSSSNYGLTNYAKTFARQKPVSSTTSSVRDIDYQPGRKVVHKKFGMGTILDVKQERDGLLVTVVFPKFGLKKLSAKYAQLELI